MVNSLEKNLKLVKEKINQIERDKESKIASIKAHFEEQIKSFKDIYLCKDLLMKSETNSTI